ncbi:MAG TPA: DUF4190 domain-containing protein [Candidatus Angelobacter sp.]|nr:DUF4190 domain-containing protein [Candidatus Angelobacter sp.]
MPGPTNGGQWVICGKCGLANAASSRFCSNCANPLTAGAAPSSAAAVPAPVVSPSIGQQPFPVTAEGAKITLGLGIASWILCGLPTGIPAIVLGHRTLKKIRESRGRLKGQEMVLAGLILGYVSCAIWVVLLIGGAVVFRSASREMAAAEDNAISTIRQINEAEATYSQVYSGTSGRLYAGSLAALGPGPSGTCAGTGDRDYACLMTGPLVAGDCREPKWCILNGYRFQLQVHYTAGSRDADYAITATPEGNGRGGTKNFCSTSDGVIRAAPVFFGSLSSGYATDGCQRLAPLGESK